MFVESADSMSPADATPIPAGMDRIIPRSELPWHRRHRRKALGGAVAIVVGAAILFLIVTARGDTMTVASDLLTQATARQEIFNDYAPVRAAVQPKSTFFVTATQEGTVATVIATDGAIVEVGTPLATLENMNFRLSVASERATTLSRAGELNSQALALRRDQRQLQQSVAEAEQMAIEAEDELKKQEFLLSRGIITESRIAAYRSRNDFQQRKLRDLRTGMANDRAVVGLQERSLATASRQVTDIGRILDAAIDSMTVRAPVGGRLTNFRIKTGQSVKQGETIGQIDSVGDVKLLAPVDEYFLARMTPGQRATAQVDGKRYDLTVSRISREVVNGRFETELEFLRQPGDLRNGQSIDVQIVMGNPRRTLLLPNGPWNKGGSTATIFVLRDGRAERRAIRIGRSNPDHVEVLSGLAAGEKIIASDTSPYQKYTTLIVR